MKLARFVALAVPLTVAVSRRWPVCTRQPRTGAVRGASATATAPTFNKDVAPILYENCATCHRPGEVAPFALLTFQDAAKRAPLIAAVPVARQMPPWKAEPGPRHVSQRAATDRRSNRHAAGVVRRRRARGGREGQAGAAPLPEGGRR
jgi:hypothetical protein